MVKKKLNRLLCLFGAVLVLLSCVVPAMTLDADALFAEGSDLDVFSWPVLLDTFTWHISGLTMDNPFLRVSNNDLGHCFEVDTSFISTTSSMPSVRGSWIFDSEYYSDTSLYGPRYLYSLFFDSEEAYNKFSFSNSSPFVVDAEELFYFFTGWEMFLDPAVKLDAHIHIDYKFPVFNYDGTWDLQERTFDQDFSWLNESVDKPLSYYVFGLFDERGFLDDGHQFKDIIVTDIQVTFECSLDSFADPDVYVSRFDEIRFINHVLPISDLISVDEFREKYPGIFVIQKVTDSSAFDLLHSLKTGVGGFMATEIIPGLSFGGMLSTALGISLVVVFLKVFGG